MDLSTSYTIKAKVTGQDQISGLTTGLDKLKTSSNNAAGAMGKLKNAAGQALGALKAIAPAIGIAAIGKFVSDTLTAGDRLEKFAQSTGVAVPLLDKLRKASELAGTDFKTLVKAFPMLANNINQASLGNAKLEAAFGDLGIAVHNSNGSLRATDEVLLDIADEFSRMKDGVDKASFAYDLFGGKTGEQLIPLLNSGRESIENLSTAMTEHGVKRMAAFNDSITEIQHAFQDTFVKLTSLLLPAFEKFVNVITFLTNKFIALPAPVQLIIGSLGIVVPLVVTLVPLLGVMVISIKAIAAVKLGVVIAQIGTAFGGLIAAVKGAMLAFAPLLAGGAIPAAIIGLGVLIYKFRDQIGYAFKKVGEFIQNFLSPLTNFIGNVFHSAMDLARNAFNRLPNIVQKAIKFATAPLRGFIKFVEKILSLLGRVKGSKIEAPKTTVSSSTAPSTSNTLYSSGFSTASSNVSATNIPKTNTFTSSLNNTTTAPLSNTTTAPRSTSSSSIPRNNSNPLVTTQLPSGGYSITNVGTGKPKPPNINIQTGNVVQMDNTNYVTTNQLQNAVQSATTQTMNYLQAGGVTYYLP